ncbi:MAG: hypothetical protein ACE5FA_01350 [Dehalococcoidia bacterium]
MRRVTFLSLLILTAVAALAIACGGDDNGDGTPTPTETGADASVTPTPGTDDGSPTPVGTPTLTSGDIELDEFVIRPGLTRARPGTVTFNVTNVGELTHDFIDDASDLPIAQLPRAEGDLGVDESQIDIVGRIDSIAPGASAQISLDLDTGNYVLMCNIVDGDKSHYITGMYNRFTVSNDAPAPVTEDAIE